MGWCSGTEIFDVVCKTVLEKESDEEILRKVILVLEDHDWDCQDDSAYIDHPVVKKVFDDLHARDG